MNMKIFAAAMMVGSAMTLAPAAGHADPYKWCANYQGFGGGENCYFKTFDQCQAQVSGRGGFCRVNGFYDGKPVRTPEDGPMPRSRR